MTEETKPAIEWPDSCTMPDLSALPAISPVFALRRFFTGHGPKDPRAYGLWVNFIRLVEKALADYRHGRDALVAHLEARKGGQPGLEVMLLASGHLETCVGTIVRAIDFGRALRRIRSDAANPIPERPLVFRDEVYGRVNDARNAAEHLDGELLHEATAYGIPALPALTKAGFDVRGKLIPYEDLAKWLMELHALACRVAGVQPEPQH